MQDRDDTTPPAPSVEDGIQESHAQTEAAPLSGSEAEPEEGDLLIGPSSTSHPLFDDVVQAIRSVYDPEIPVNIFDLGLIYRIAISEENAVEVDMTLTAPGCPVAGEIPGWVADAISPVPGVKQVDVEIVWDPPWDMSRLTDEARLELGML
ncbi:MAG: SUF system Fe-S cluster assembly protein [Pseudomonadota bacterium]